MTATVDLGALRHNVRVLQARAEGTDLRVADPDGEITDADWFETLPADTRDREQLREWRRCREE
ncbi:MAG: hypothetical protein ABEL97_01995 [Salinibacter sp.]